MSTNSESRHGLTSIYSAQELMATELPDPKSALPGVLPEGVSLLVGAPKLGKSFLMLNLATAVATGGVALGVAPVERGSALSAVSVDPNEPPPRPRPMGSDDEGDDPPVRVVRRVLIDRLVEEEQRRRHAHTTDAKDGHEEGRGGCAGDPRTVMTSKIIGGTST